MRLWRYRQVLPTLVFVFLLVCAQLLHFGDLGVHLELQFYYKIFVFADYVFGN